MGDLGTRELDAKFAELICADTEWLRSEFDALMSAAFGVPPAWPGRPSPPRVPPPASSRPGPGALQGAGTSPVLGGHPTARRTGRLPRSPPLF